MRRVRSRSGDSDPLQVFGKEANALRGGEVEWKPEERARV
jgi:hypothetical protein